MVAKYNLIPVGIKVELASINPKQVAHFEPRKPGLWWFIYWSRVLRITISRETWQDKNQRFLAEAAVTLRKNKKISILALTPTLNLTQTLTIALTLTLILTQTLTIIKKKE